MISRWWKIHIMANIYCGWSGVSESYNFMEALCQTEAAAFPGNPISACIHAIWEWLRCSSAQILGQCDMAFAFLMDVVEYGCDGTMDS